MLFLYKLIEKSLLLRNSSFAIFSLNLDTTAKVFPSTDIHLKTLTKRWNQTNLGYFTFHLDKAHGKGKIVSIRKNLYYKNIVLFIQCLQSLVTFWGAALVKANIATLFRNSALKWFMSKLSNLDQDVLNNNSGVKS